VKDKRSVIIILFAVLGVLLLLYFMFSNTSGKRYQWNENYKSESDQPYGTKFIKELLKSYRPAAPFVFNEKKPLHQLLDSARIKDSDADYIFIGRSLYLDKADEEALLDFIRSGHDAFVASIDLPFNLVDPIYVNECEGEMALDQYEVKSVNLNFYHDTLRTQKGYDYQYRFGAENQSYFWNALNPDIFCDSVKSIIALGYQQPDRVNFFKLPYGSGNLYIHTNPLVFTNYFLSKPDKVEYASGVFSHLRGKSIIWDEYSKAKFAGSNNTPYDSPLSYILQQPSLKYAWWMMLASVVLYTLFAAKRKQRVVPVREEKANTSLEFVYMISALHFQNTDHLDIATKKMKYFLYFIRARYGVYAQQFTEAHILRLAEKSKVEVKDIQVIFDEYKIVENKVYNDNTADQLVNLYNAIENFYKRCK